MTASVSATPWPCSARREPERNPNSTDREWQSLSCDDLRETGTAGCTACSEGFEFDLVGGVLGNFGFEIFVVKCVRRLFEIC